jgi:hypothetical protein
VSITSIDNEAFSGCSSLTSFTSLASTPPSLGTGVFTNTHASLAIKVPSVGVAAYKAAANWSAYASRIVAQ